MQETRRNIVGGGEVRGERGAGSGRGSVDGQDVRGLLDVVVIVHGGINHGALGELVASVACAGAEGGDEAEGKEAPLDEVSHQ